MSNQTVSDSKQDITFWLFRSFIFPSNKSSVSNFQLAKRVALFTPNNSLALLKAEGGIQ